MERTDIIIVNLGYAEHAGEPEDQAAYGKRPDGGPAGSIGGRSGGRNSEDRTRGPGIARLLRQQEAGVDWIPVGDFAPRERLKAHAAAFGLAFDPAAAEAAPHLADHPWAGAFREARAHLAALPVPVMLGPYTFAKRASRVPAGEALERLAPVYAAALRELEAAGAEWVQIEEPELARPVPPEHWPHIMRTWRAMHDAAPRLRLMLQPTPGAPEDIGRLLELPVAGIGLDFTADGGRALRDVAMRGFPSDRMLGAGIIDGRSFWRADLRSACELLERLRSLVPKVRLALQPTCSLAHAPAAPRKGRVPHGLPRHALATADVKLGELRVLRAALLEGREAVKLDLADSDVTQDILRALLPAPMPDGDASAGRSPGQAREHAAVEPHAS